MHGIQEHLDNDKHVDGFDTFLVDFGRFEMYDLVLIHELFKNSIICRFDNLLMFCGIFVIYFVKFGMGNLVTLHNLHS